MSVNKTTLLPSLLATGSLLITTRSAFAFEFSQNGPELVYSLLLLLFVGSGVLFHFRNRVGLALKYTAVWLGIFLVLAIGYSFRGDVMMVADRVMGNLIEDRGSVANGEISFPAGRNGHFFIEASVNGEPVRFLVDTGASSVALSQTDARRLGFAPETLTFDQPTQTANGPALSARVRLDRVAVGPVVVEDVRATVSNANLNQSLLGMSFLSRIGGYRVEAGRLILTP